MKLIIHGGMHKTGTSSLQSAIYDHPNTCDIYHQNEVGSKLLCHDVAVYFSVLYPEEYSHYHVTSKADRQDFKLKDVNIPQFSKSAKEQIIHNLKNKKEKIIMSGEDFRFMKPNHIDRFLSLIDPFITDYEFVFYVRPPYSFSAAMIDQLLKNNPTEKIENLNYQPNYFYFDNFKNYNHVLIKYDDTMSVINDFANRYNLSLNDRRLNKRKTYRKFCHKINEYDLKWAENFFTEQELLIDLNKVNNDTIL